jgi:hypothetical protein
MPSTLAHARSCGVTANSQPVICKILMPLLGLSETNTIDYYTITVRGVAPTCIAP